MSYTVIWDPKALKSLEKMERDICKRIVAKVDFAKEEPFLFVERLTGEKLYKLRVGDYRVILDIDKRKKEIVVRFAGHRSRIYKILQRVS